jgi:hypothetical protein
LLGRRTSREVTSGVGGLTEAKPHFTLLMPRAE